MVVSNDDDDDDEEEEEEEEEEEDNIDDDDDDDDDDDEAYICDNHDDKCDIQSFLSTSRTEDAPSNSSLLASEKTGSSILLFGVTSSKSVSISIGNRTRVWQQG